jgi:hypothetical protein
MRKSAFARKKEGTFKEVSVPGKKARSLGGQQKQTRN